MNKQEIKCFIETLKIIFDDYDKKYSHNISKEDNLKKLVPNDVYRELIWNSFITGELEIVKNAEFRKLCILSSIRLTEFDIEYDYIIYKGITYKVCKGNENTGTYCVYRGSTFVI